MTKTTTKEDGEPERRRRQSANEEDDEKGARTQGGLALSEARDRDDGEGGGKRR